MVLNTKDIKGLYKDELGKDTVGYSYFKNTVELHSSGRWLSGSPIIRIGLALRVNILYCKRNTSFYGLNFFPYLPKNIRNYILIYYLYENKYVA